MEASGGDDGSSGCTDQRGRGGVVVPPPCLLGFGAGKKLLEDWSREDVALCVVVLAVRDTRLTVVEGRRAGRKKACWRSATNRSRIRRLEEQWHTNVFKEQQVKTRAMDSVAAEAEGCPSDQGPPQTAIPRWLLFVCICICLPRGNDALIFFCFGFSKGKVDL